MVKTIVVNEAFCEKNGKNHLNIHANIFNNTILIKLKCYYNIYYIPVAKPARQFGHAMQI